MDFPILRLMREDFIEYYFQQGHGYPHPFKKLCFVFNFQSDVRLRCYALNNERNIMNPSENGIALKYKSDGIVPINIPFKTGTLELTVRELSPVIGTYDNPNADFLYLRFEPKKYPSIYFIAYDVYYNDQTVAFAVAIPAKKPSPPYGQD